MRRMTTAIFFTGLTMITAVHAEELKSKKLYTDRVEQTFDATLARLIRNRLIVEKPSLVGFQTTSSGN